MKPTTQLLRLGFAVLLLALPSLAFAGAPPQTGLRVRTFYSQPGSSVEIAPGVWVGQGGFTIPVAKSFTVLSARSGREVGQFTTDFTGVLEISLPPGSYIVVPAGCGALTEPFALSVRPKQFIDALVYFGPCTFSAGGA